MNISACRDGMIVRVVMCVWLCALARLPVNFIDFVK